MTLLIEKDICLAPYTTMKTGGPAEFFCRLTSASDFIESCRFASQNNLAIHVLGSGSNVLISDSGVKGLVILNKCSDSPQISDTVSVGSSMLLDDFVVFCIEHGLGDLSFASGIPGTVGGAIYGNAGAFGQCIGDFLKGAELINYDGTAFAADHAYFKFQYRDSVLKKHPAFILSLQFELTMCNPQKMWENRAEILALRHEKHPGTETGSCGSFFKNIDSGTGSRRKAAGLYLDRAGAKQMNQGGACVFERHANIIINPENATSDDVYQLSKKMKMEVQQKFGILLEEEVIFWGKF